MTKVAIADRNYKAVLAWFDFVSELDEVLHSVLIFFLCFYTLSNHRLERSDICSFRDQKVSCKPL